MFAIGTVVRSTMNSRLFGPVVGYGTLKWPRGEDIEGDREPRVVYLVQIREGSCSLGPACVAFRSDHVVEESVYQERRSKEPWKCLVCFSHGCSTCHKRGERCDCARDGRT